MTNPDDEMRAALAKMGRAVLNSWDKKDQEIQRLQRENARLLAKHEPWWNCTHKWQTLVVGQFDFSGHKRIVMRTISIPSGTSL